MNIAIPTSFALHLAGVSLLVLLACGAFHQLLRHRSASLRELVWRAGFAVLLLLPFSWWLRPWSLVPPAPAGMIPTAVVPAPPGLLHSKMHPPLSEDPATAESGPGFPWQETAAGLWLAGAVLLISLQAIGIRQRRRWLTTAVAAPDTGAAALLRNMDPGKNIRLLVSPDCPVPLTWSNIVILPAASLAWDPGMLRAALGHEMEHVRRRDFRWRSLGGLAAAVYWPMPWVWVARACWHRLQEQAADDAVLREGTDPDQYAGLLCTAARAWIRPAAGTLSMARPSSLECRLHAILHPALDRSGYSRKSALVAASAALAVFGLSALAQPPRPDISPPPAKPLLVPDINFPSIKFTDTPLDEVLQQVSRRTGELAPDRRSPRLGTDSSSAALPVTLELRGVSLRSLLSILAQQTGTRMEPGKDGTTLLFRKGAALDSPSGVDAQAKAIPIDNLDFKNATVEQMVEGVRTKARLASQNKPRAALPEVVVQDAGTGTYSLSLKNTNAWEALDQIAKTAGMHGAGIRYLDGQGSSILLSRDVKTGEDLGLTTELMRSPLCAQLLALKLPEVHFEGSLKQAATLIAGQVKAASEGKLNFSIQVDPAIADQPTQFSTESPGSAVTRLVMLSGVGTYEVTLAAPDTVRIRPKPPR